MENKTAQFLTDFNLETEAEASVNIGGRANWIKFIVTDDIPNGNNQKIPREEFPNIIKTGMFMPIKMALGSIENGHNDAFPLGTITNLKESENKVEGLGMLWSKERPDDIEMIGSKTKEGKLPQLSWEVSYTDSLVDESGVESLQGVALNAVCVVGMPAYAGRTPIVAFASQKSNSEEISVEELEQFKSLLEEARKSLAEKETLLADTLKELNELKEYKASIEKKEAEEAAFAELKKKFSDAGIVKDDEYFSTNRDNLLSLPTNALDFMIQELVSLASKSSSASAKSVEIPNIQNKDKELSKDPRELGRLLRESKNK